LQKIKILIFTYYWPPSGGSGVQRWLYFSKYLKDFGWHPIIITVKKSKASYSVIDDSLEGYVDDLVVYRTNTIEPLKFYSNLIFGNSNEGIQKGEVFKKNFFHHLAAFIRGNFFIPDARKGWVNYALKKGREIIKNEEVKYMVTTGPPHSSHLIGLNLKQEFSLKWIVDFRDPWSSMFYLKEMYRTKYAQKKDERLEKKVLIKADKILTTIGDSFHDELIQKSNIFSEKLFSIPNGYDSDLINYVNQRLNSTFHIVYSGLLTNNHSFKPFFLMLKDLKSIYPKLKIRVSLAGQISDDVDLFIRENLVNIDYVNSGYLPHIQSINLIKKANLLLNFTYYGDSNNKMIPGKVLEYIATGIPILSIGNTNNYLSRFLLKGSCAKTFLDNDLTKMRSFTEKVINAYIKNKPLKNSFPNIENFSRKALTEKLSNLLKKDIDQIK